MIFYVTNRILYNSELFFIYSCHLYYIFHIKKFCHLLIQICYGRPLLPDFFLNMKNVIEMTTIYEKQLAII